MTVLGLVQEQHPDRAQLYADWQELHFPILWDPFNTTGVEVVLVSSLIDENGIVRATNLNPRDGDAFRALLDTEWPPEKKTEATTPFVTPAMGRVRIAHPPGSSADAKAAMSRVLWAHEENEGLYDGLVRSLEKRLDAKDATPADHFRAGVARRLRFDAGFGEAGDVQSGIDHWVEALRQNPNQYIWRRRIQQWGPRLDKPYPFYDWVAEAIADLTERGTPPPPLRAPLTGSEIAGRAPSGKSPIDATAESPDPEGKVHRDESAGREGPLVQLEIACAPSSDPDKQAARVHVSLIPTRGNHWTTEADPPLLWIAVGEAAPFLVRVEQPEGEAPTGSATVDFEIEGQAASKDAPIHGYALYSICTADDTCVYRRQDF